MIELAAKCDACGTVVDSHELTWRPDPAHPRVGMLVVLKLAGRASLLRHRGDDWFVSCGPACEAVIAKRIAKARDVKG